MKLKTTQEGSWEEEVEMVGKQSWKEREGWLAWPPPQSGGPRRTHQWEKGAKWEWKDNENEVLDSLHGGGIAQMDLWSPRWGCIVRQLRPQPYPVRPSCATFVYICPEVCPNGANPFCKLELNSWSSKCCNSIQKILNQKKCQGDASRSSLEDFPEEQDSCKIRIHGWFVICTIEATPTPREGFPWSFCVVGKFSFLPYDGPFRGSVVIAGV